MKMEDEDKTSHISSLPIYAYKNASGRMFEMLFCYHTSAAQKLVQSH